MKEKRKGYKNLNKFVAYFDSEFDYENMSAFYLIDINKWNREHGTALDQRVYNEHVYDALLELGCEEEGENFFVFYKKINSVEELGEFVKPLPWLIAVDQHSGYIDPETIPGLILTNKREKTIDVLKAYEGKVIFDEVFMSDKLAGINENSRRVVDDIEHKFLFFAVLNNIPYEYFFPDDGARCRKWLEKNKGKVIFSTGSNVYAFDDEKTIDCLKENSPEYQKLLSILNNKNMEKETLPQTEQLELQYKNFLDCVKRFAKSNKDKIFIDTTFEKALKIMPEERRIINNAMLEITKGAYYKSVNISQFNKPCPAWINKCLDFNNVIYCLPRGEEEGILISFLNKEKLNGTLKESESYVRLRKLLAEKEDKLENFNRNEKNEDYLNFDDTEDDIN